MAQNYRNNSSPIYSQTPPKVYNPESKHPRTPFPKWLLALAIIVLVATFIIPRLNFVAFTDWIRTLGYEPSSEIVAIEDKIQLTDTGRGIFHATRPALEDNEAFNRDCSSHDHDVSILGCYTSGQIYIYNVDTSELSGVTESTAAHELLHAAWERLSSSERQRLTPLLNQVYDEHHDELASELANYNESEQLDELHSRIGTQIASLPDELESHYAQYFQDQDAVVGFYDQYKTPFRELQQQLDTLSSELDTLKAQIDSKTTEYEQRATSLGSKITEFNNCASTPNCFTNAEFNSQRSTLVTEQSAVSNLYTELSRLIDTYNAKVDQYNSNVLRTQTLQDSINSNSTPPTI